jgi:hypothetical protein
MQMMKRWLRRGCILPAAAVCALLVPVTASQAALVNYTFTGSIDGLPSAPLSGSFQFDNATSGSGGVYNGAVKGLTLNLANFYTASSAAGFNAITVAQNIPLGGGNGDRWGLVTAATGPAVFNGFTPFSVDLSLSRLGGGLFTNTNLQDPPSINSVNGVTGKWRIIFENADGDPTAFHGSITSLSLTAVPLPAAVLLFGAGLISLVGLGAGGLRNLRKVPA